MAAAVDQAPSSFPSSPFVVEGAVRPWGDGLFEYMHPRPGALHVSELTSIAVREGDLVIPTDLDALFDVKGRQSGKVDGRVVLARDNKTVLFYPDKPFVPGDSVTVQLRPGLRELYFFGVGRYFADEIGQSVITTREGDLVWWTQEVGKGGGMLGVTPRGHLVHWDKQPNDTAETAYELNSTYQLDRHTISFDGDSAILVAYTKTNGTVHNVVHVLDADKNVLLEWRTIDDFIGAADPTLAEATKDPEDAYHTNSAERTPDGNVIVSMRNCNLVLLLSGKTGQILWRMGGHTNDFTFIGEDMDPPFVGQHDVQQLADGNILMYDNGLQRGIGGTRPSRALELSLDLNKMTATKVWSFTHPNKMKSFCCGGVQKVDNGEGNPPTMLISWGYTGPFFTEVTYEENPTIIREFEGLDGHRGLLQSWEGFSTERPRLLLCSDANTQASGGQPSIARLQDWTMHFSFNGVTGISKWRLYIGADSDVPLSRHLMERSKTAFEEIITLQELVDTMAARNVTLTTDSNANTTDVALYVRVVPVKGDSELLRPSKALKVPLVVSSRDEESGAVSVSPPRSAVPCRCYQPDIGLREHLGRPKPERESPVVDMVAVSECARACADSDKCETFFFFEDTGECQMDEKKHEGRYGRTDLHSLGGVVSGRRNCMYERLA
ncbi:unnamed protein product [Vitrella brassicaformis CCMP3155]|uniref:Apple domain-containing protein n=1 Tax=Vitrella brassicaformis (strain CCMP3155) TaxID=1169540 RepID=A0A0G4GJ27_VITBC|nr:unnamed protein product [Vitrella brassicaformis CCMP3155]|eukprot:CEM29820.1 unnamed protein product [Vitrella brassicaformis CCMP3155]